MVGAISNHAISSNVLLAGAFGPGLTPEVTSIQRTQSNDAGKTKPKGHESTAQSDGGDTVEISDAAKALAATLSPSGSTKKANQQSKVGDLPQSQDQNSVGQKSAGGNKLGSQPLSDREKQEVRKLKRRDTEVRTHEQAHAAAAGGHARGGPKLEFQKGPDGKQYAVSGEVSIDTSPVSGNPQATITKMQQVRRAALAPAQPSSQDRAVAAQAQAAERQARAELAKQRQTPAGGAGGNQTQQAQSVSGSTASTRQTSTSANPGAAAEINFSNPAKRQAPNGPTIGLILDITS